MEEEADLSIGKPLRKKRFKRILKAKKRGHVLNSSRLLHSHCTNTSLNSTVVKQTLRANNRALAKALEQKRQHLNVAQQIITQLQEELQESQQRLSNLQHIAGLKDAAIEAEVQLHIQNYTNGTKTVLSNVCAQLLSTVELIHGALDISSCRTSSTSRPSTPMINEMPSTHRNVYYSGPSTETRPLVTSAAHTESQVPTECEPLPDPSDPDHDCSLGDGELPADAAVGHPDLSVIMEQSCFIDHLAIPFTDEDQAGGGQFVSFRPRQKKDSDRHKESVRTLSSTTLSTRSSQSQQRASEVTITEGGSRRNSAQVSTSRDGGSRRNSAQVSTSRECVSRRNSSEVSMSHDGGSRRNSAQVSTSRECVSRRNSAQVAPRLSPSEEACPSLPDTGFAGMSMEEAFGKRDAGRYRADERPLPTLAKKLNSPDYGVVAAAPHRQPGDIAVVQGRTKLDMRPTVPVAETSSNRTRKQTNSKRAGRVSVQADSAATTISEKVASMPGDGDKTGTFDLQPPAAITSPTQNFVALNPQEGSDDGESEVGISEERLDDILLPDYEGDTLVDSPACDVVDTDVVCVGDDSLGQTMCCVEDMEMTEVLNVTMVLGRALISKQPVQEPSFLANVDEGHHAAAIEEAEQLLAPETSKAIETRKLGTKKSSRKNNDPSSRHKLTLKKGKTSRKSKKADPICDDDGSSQTTGVGETVTKKFSTYITKPGQMAFTTGKLSDMAPPKGTSMLPRVTARSKPRAKPKVDDRPATKDSTASSHVTGGEPKSVFDMSMNESVIMVRTKYSDFREHCGSSSNKDSGSDDAASDTNNGDGQHGIMLTLGNGKRTKPRRARSKQVSYASHSVNVVVAPPSDVVTPLSNHVTSPSDDQSSSTGRAPDDVLGQSDGLMSSDDAIFPSDSPLEDTASPEPSGRIKRPRMCSRSAVYAPDTPDASLPSSGDTTDDTDCDEDRMRGHRRSRKAIVCSDSETDGCAGEEDVVIVDTVTSDTGSGKQHKVMSKQASQLTSPPTLTEDKHLEDRGRYSGSMAESGRRRSVNKDDSEGKSEAKRKEDGSKPKQKEDSSKLKQREDSSKLKQKEDSSKLKSKEDSSKPKQKEDSSKPKQKEDSSKPKQKEDSSKLKPKEDSSKPKQKEDSSKPKQKESSSNANQKAAECNVIQEDEVNVNHREDGSKLKQRDDNSKLKQKEDGSKQKSSKLKQIEEGSKVKQKEDGSKVKQKEDGSKPKQKEDHSKLKHKDDGSNAKQKDDESSVSQREDSSKATKKSSCHITQKKIVQHPATKVTHISKLTDILPKEKNDRTLPKPSWEKGTGKCRAGAVPRTATRRDEDKENTSIVLTDVSVSHTPRHGHTTNVCGSGKKQKTKKDSVQGGKPPVRARKRSADEATKKRSADHGGAIVLEQTATPCKPRASVTRDSNVDRTSTNLSESSPPKRRCRAASKVNYAEPSLNQKLRQGDAHTFTLYIGKNGEKIVPAVQAGKTKSVSRLSRRPFDTITNDGRISLISRSSDVV